MSVPFRESIPPKIQKLVSSYENNPSTNICITELQSVKRAKDKRLQRTTNQERVLITVWLFARCTKLAESVYLFKNISWTDFLLYFGHTS